MTLPRALVLVAASFALPPALGAESGSTSAQEQLRFETPPGYRERDRADPSLSAAAIPMDEPGVLKRLLFPEQPPGERIARIVVESRPDDQTTVAAQFAAERGEMLKQACPGGDAAIAAEREEGMYRVVYAMAQCPKDPRGLGVVTFTKVIFGGERVYTAEAQYQYPPFEPGKTPLLKSQMAQAMKWLAGVKVCQGAGDRECRMPAKRIGEMQPRPTPVYERASVAGIERAGWLLYQHDRLAWHGSDALTAGKVDLAGATGYVTELDGEGSGRFIVAGGDPGAPFGLQQVDLAQFKPVRVTDLRRAPLPEMLAHAYRARQIALAAKPQQCGEERMNSAVFPDPAGNGLLAYWMSSTSQPDLIMLGGHTRFRTSADGSAIRERLAMTRSCLTMRQERNQTAFSRLLVSHLTTDMPTEIHVFNSLHYKVPIVVFAPKGTWLVRDGKIERLL